MLRLLIVSSFVSLALADVCEILAQSIHPDMESYTKGRVCHSLFWVVPGSSYICQHTSLTRSWCPDRYPVLQADADSILSDPSGYIPSLVDESTARELLSSISTTSEPATSTEPVLGLQRRARSIVLPIPSSFPVSEVSTAAGVSLFGDSLDICTMMHPDSYETSSGMCHGLFWVDSARTEFCFHSARTAATCPAVPGNEVSMAEAVPFIEQLDHRPTRSSGR